MDDDYILTTSKLSREFKGFYAVRNVDLKVRRGTIHALIGPNGAGKTTIFNLLTRTIAATSGTILYQGHDITRQSSDQVARRGLVRSFQISSVFPHLTVYENIEVALQRKHDLVYQFWRSKRALQGLRGEVERLIDRFGLGDSVGRPAVELPYGRKRVLEIATTVALEPDLLLLDEPTQGMGHEDIHRITALIREIAADRTVLMVEHNLGVVADLSDTITVLQRGEVLAEGGYAAVSKNPDVITAYLGTDHA